MNYSVKSENREYLRVVTDFPTEFKFLGDDANFPDFGKTFTGSITSLGGGGLMLAGPLADRSWIPRFIWQKITIGVKFELPGCDHPIASLCRVSWIEADEKSDSKNVKFGLAFREISNRDHDVLFDYIIHSQMK